MKILKIQLKHIGPFDDHTQIFPNGVIAICGANGSGKTTILEAIPLILFGTTPSRTGSIYDRVTKDFKGTAEATLTFEINGVGYIAIVTVNTSRKTPVSEYHLYSQESGKLLVGPKFTDYNNMIRSMIGSPDLFFASVFSSQRDYGDICLAKPAERKEIFSQMLSIGEYDVIRNKITYKTKGITDVLQPARWTIERCDKDMAVKQEFIKPIDIKAIDSGIITTKEKVKFHEDLMGKETEFSAGIQAQIDTINRETNDRKSAMENLMITKKEIAALIKPDAVNMDQDIKAMEDKVAIGRDLYKTLEKEKEIASESANKQDKIKAEGSVLKKEFAMYMKQAKTLSSIPDNPDCKACPLAGEFYTANDKAMNIKKIQIPAKILELNAITVKEFDNEYYIKVRNGIDSLEAKINTMRTKMTDAAEGIKTFDTQLSTLKERELNFNKRIDELASVTTKNVADIQASKQESEERSNRAYIESTSAQQLLTSFEKQKTEYDLLNGQIAVLSNERIAAQKTIEESEGELNILETLNVAFGKNGIAQLVIDNAASEFENIANELLNIATDGRMTINFVTQKTLKDGTTAEALDIIINNNNMSYDVSEYSGGEQKLIKTVIRLTLSLYMARKAENKLRSLFIDEIFDDLDDNNSQKILQVIDHLQTYFEQILIISHSDELLLQLPNVIKLKKG